MKSKVIVQSIALPNATAAQVKSFPLDTPSDYKTVRGFYVIRNSGTEYLNISIKDAAGNVILEAVNIKHLEVGNTVAIKDKFFKETPFKAGGSKMQVVIENFVTTAAIQDIDVVYLVDNEPYL